MAARGKALRPVVAVAAEDTDTAVTGKASLLATASAAIEEVAQGRAATDPRIAQDRAGKVA
jgi:hypothetical protein